MNAEINDLFEEGITRCRELTDAADEAMGQSLASYGFMEA